MIGILPRAGAVFGVLGAVTVGFAASSVHPRDALAMHADTNRPVARAAQAPVPAPVTTAAHRALSSADAGLDVRLARWTSHYGPRQLTSRIAVTNVAVNAADVLLTLYDYDDWPIDGCGEACHATIPPGATHTWWLPDLPGMPDEDERRIGRALVRSTRPVVAAVHEVSLRAGPDASATGGADATAYAGVAADAAQGHGTQLLAPAMLNSARLGAIGTGDSVIDIWNLHATDATTVTLSLVTQSSPALVSSMEHLEPGTGKVIDPFETSWVVPVDVYAGLFAADRPIAALVQTAWPDDQGAAMYGGGEGATTTVLPLVTGAFVNRCSQITIQNTNADAAVQASLGFYPESGLAPKHVMRLSVPSRASSTISPCGNGELANALGYGFLGSVRVASMDGETRFGVQTFLDVMGTKAVAGWVGQPADRAAARLHAPIVHSGWQSAGRDDLPLLSTAIVITNAGEEPVDVRATYQGVAGDCAGEAYAQGPVSVAGRGTVALEPAEQGILPANCLAAATVASTGGVFAVVYDEGYAPPEPERSPEALLPYAAR